MNARGLFEQIEYELAREIEPIFEQCKELGVAIMNYKSLMKMRGFELAGDNKRAITFKRRSTGNKGLLQVEFNHERKNVRVNYQKTNHKFGNIYDECYLKYQDLIVIAKTAQELYKEKDGDESDIRSTEKSNG